ncbi:hypothetical protein ND450_16045 [Lentzea sp. HUAS12]|nr:hypothetical protein [Lentzea sp. HUAS12]USX55551.1 hypothetical protein ND450_16045 [Lentzea sp. HUAS12]
MYWNAASGWLNRTVTSLGPLTSTAFTAASSCADSEAVAGSSCRASENRTSWAVTGSPFQNFTPWRIR